jgi:hypothetical protein
VDIEAAKQNQRGNEQNAAHPDGADEKPDRDGDRGEQCESHCGESRMEQRSHLVRSPQVAAHRGYEQSTGRASFSRGRSIWRARFELLRITGTSS